MDAVKTIKLDHGKANTLDLEQLARLEGELEEARNSSATRAVLITASGHIFSAGVDLFRLLRGGDDYIRKFLPALFNFLRDLFLFPKPVIAAINGHAIAGGCLIVLASDYRLMASGEGLIGVTELRVGVPFPSAAFEIIRFAVPPQHLQEIVYRALTYRPGDALAKGLIDEVTEPAALMTRAMAIAQELAQIFPDVFAETKQKVRGNTAMRGESLDNETLEAWTDPATLERVKAYLTATLGKSA